MKRLLMMMSLRLLVGLLYAGSWQSFEVVQCKDASQHTNGYTVSFGENGNVTGMERDTQIPAHEGLGTDRTYKGTTLRQTLQEGSIDPSHEISAQLNLTLERSTDTSDDDGSELELSCVPACVESAPEHLLESCPNISLPLRYSVECRHPETLEEPNPPPAIQKWSIKMKREWNPNADRTPSDAAHQGKFCFCVSAAECYEVGLQCTCVIMEKCRIGRSKGMTCIDRNAVCPEGSSTTTAETASTKTNATTTTTSTTNTTSTSTTISTTTNNDARSALPPEASSSSLTILLILLLLLAVVIIIVGVTWFIRRRKRNGRNEGSPTMATNQAETGYQLYATVDADNRPLGVSSQIVNNIYSDLELTQQPTPSNNNVTCASVQPNNGAVDLSRNVYEEIAFVEEDQQKPSCGANQATTSLSPVYSQPFDPSASAANAVYAEPFNPDKKSPATAPILSHQTTRPTVDQHNVYSLATAIPTADPNPVYAEPIKTAKSQTIEAATSTNSIHQETTIMNSQNEAVITVDATVATDSSRPSVVTSPPVNNVRFSTDLDVTQRPMPSNNTIYASVQPTSGTVDMGKNIVYADLDLSKKEQQKTSSVNETTTNPVSSQPFDPPSSATNVVHTEPFNISQSSVLTAPVLSHTTPTVDQQNVYSLAAAIPTVDPNPVCSEPNEKVKPPTAEERKAVDPVYQKEVEEKAEAETGDVAKQDPSVVNMYTESIKL